MTLLGVISDTHGLLRPEALDALRGSDLIIHAGDVGKPEILKRLREIAPVVAVRGKAGPAVSVSQSQSHGYAYRPSCSNRRLSN
jgi:putative phosphoesterase